MIDLRCGDWRQVLQDVQQVDLLCVDAPYSAKTHAGHFAGSTDASELDRERLKRKGYDDKRTLRKPLMYASWTDQDVYAFVRAWAPRCRGWMVSITDDVLAHTWQRAYEDAGLYAFPPLPFVEIGKQPRLTGDGPASWTCWIMVARPRSREFASWGSLPGAYCTESKDQQRIPGGKPIWLMQRLVNDYSRPGDLVCDPCAGGATTLIAAHQAGRHGIGSELDPVTYAKAKARVDTVLSQPLLFADPAPKAAALFAEEPAKDDLPW